MRNALHGMWHLLLGMMFLAIVIAPTTVGKAIAGTLAVLLVVWVLVEIWRENHPPS